MGTEGRGGRRLSVARELRLLSGAIDALIVAERQGCPSPRSGSPVASGLVVLRERILAVERVVRGIASPSQLLCSENEAGLHAEGEDLLLPEWTSEEVVSHWELEWKRARARLDREQQERQAMVSPRNEMIIPDKPTK
jgi:hypothetical protein